MPINPMGLGAIRLPASTNDAGDPPEWEWNGTDVDLPGQPEIDPSTAAKIETPDGGVVIYIGSPKIAKKDTKFDSNLAEALDKSVLGGIAQDLIQLIEQDDEARKEWLETRARGIEQLGLKIEPMRTGSGEGSAPLDGMSNARSTLLIEAVVRFGANAFAELVPTDGPAKVSEITSNQTPELDELADALEDDLNDYLLNVDKPWVADTDAMLMRVGVDGSVFKKVYHDPILRRPISRAVSGEDIIINNSATSIYDAKRITHRVMMEKSTLRRMQIVGAYRDFDLGEPGYPVKSAPDMQVDSISGIRKGESYERDDRPYELYECYCELDLKGFEHETKGKPDGLAIPYKVVIAKEQREILEIRRNYREDDEMCLPKTWFVQYSFIRGFGPYGIGLSHLLGNMTGGLTAIIREFIDAGMFANFPGGIIAKGAGRQNRNILRAEPGAFVEIETGGLPVDQVCKPLPYKGPDPVSVAFAQALEQSGQRLGGTAEVMVGEGRQDAPVGTTLALIEQAIKPLLATHKRLCASEADELQLLVERFREDPEAFWRSRPQRTATQWDEQTFLQAVNSRQIVTRADPNTASHLQRMLRNAALYQMAKDDPGSFNVLRIRQACIRGIGFSNPDQYLNQNPAPPPPDPKGQAAVLTGQADLIDAQTKAQELEFKRNTWGGDVDKASMDNKTKLAVAHTQLQREQMIQQGEMARAGQSDKAKLAGDHMQRQHEAAENQKDRMHEAQQTQQQAAVDMQGRQMEHQSAMEQAHLQHQSAVQQAGMQHQNDMQQNAMQQQHEAQQNAMQGQQQERIAAAKPAPASGRKERRAQGGRTPATEKPANPERDPKQRTLFDNWENIYGDPKYGRPTGNTGSIYTARGGTVKDDTVPTPYGVAKRAPDGELYVRHPQTGKYFRVKPRAR